MSKAGRYEEAYDFLVGVRPEIKSYEQLPEDIQGVLMQWASIVLMQVSKAEARKAAWQAFAQNLRAHGSWWLEDPRDRQSTSCSWVIWTRPLKKYGRSGSTAGELADSW